MDVSQFLGGSLLTHSDLLQPYQIGTLAKVEMRLIGQGESATQKICVTFQELPHKALGLNKTNLRRIAELYSTDSAAWIGRQLLLYRSATDFQGQRTLCVRIGGPQQAPAEAICDALGNAVLYQPQAAAAPAAAAPQQAAAPVAAVPVAAVPQAAAPVQAPVVAPQAAQPQQVSPWQGAPPQPQPGVSIDDF